LTRGAALVLLLSAVAGQGYAQSPLLGSLG
jgi:hypothetical protein